MSNSRIFGDLKVIWASQMLLLLEKYIYIILLSEILLHPLCFLFFLSLSLHPFWYCYIFLSLSLSLGHSPCHSCCQAGDGVMLGGMEPDGERDGEVCYSLCCHTRLEWLAASLISMSSRPLQLSLSHKNIKTHRTDVRHNWPQENGYESDCKDNWYTFLNPLSLLFLLHQVLYH